jgi:hypothetical protein
MKKRKRAILHSIGTTFDYGPSEYDYLFNLPPDEGWFNSIQYMELTLGEIVSKIIHKDLERISLSELFDRTPPQSLKCSSMRLMRYKRKGYLRMRRKGRAHIYRLTENGWFEALSNFKSKHMPPTPLRLKFRSL